MELKECVSLVSLGCPKNLVDSEVMLGLLIENGYRISQQEEEAEIIIVNTCSFVKEAKEESIETILELAEFKKKGNCRLLVVTGCLPQRYQDVLVEELPEVDIFIGTGEFQKVVEILDRVKESANPLKSYIGVPQFIYTDKTPRVNTFADYSAYVKIAEGCSNSCSYCVIGKIRGQFRSRPPDHIISEVKNLVRMGVKEINLIGQDTTLYGRDINPVTDLEELLRRLTKIDKLEWIRTLYTHPAHFTDGLIRVIKEEEKICKYIDLPIQHINDKILEAMNRKTKGRFIRKLIERLRKEVPDICIRTSLIVGFPGETDEQFEELLRFVKEIEFDRLGAFEYSREEGTPASTFPDQISKKIKAKRYRRLMETQKEIVLRNNKRLIGTNTKVLIEGLNEDTGLLKGRIPSQSPDVDGVMYLTKGQADPGEIFDVVITDVHEYDLMGKLMIK
ncbi:MAG: 30S ribosomal protein S12 methylthiotransferase RimO [Deltaproteobacteria bacterium]|jgi:ribosomal protein S12 methylthiotransferase|nr:MAG: 30S ribosomal protein S12 methylthiotransferase RimO [Deltaproteobacteria bacterium]